MAGALLVNKQMMLQIVFCLTRPHPDCLRFLPEVDRVAGYAETRIQQSE